MSKIFLTLSLFFSINTNAFYCDHRNSQYEDCQKKADKIQNDPAGCYGHQCYISWGTVDPKTNWCKDVMTQGRLNFSKCDYNKAMKTSYDWLERNPRARQEKACGHEVYCRTLRRGDRFDP